MSLQLQDLRQRMRPVLSKRAGLGFGLWGEPGVGKSFAVGRLLEDMPCKTLRLHATWPLSAWVAALPKTRDEDGFLHQAIRRLANNGPLSLPNTTDALLGILAKTGPVLVHVEDIHEANPERLALVQHMLERISFFKGVALVLTSRAAFEGPLQDKVFAMQWLPLSAPQAAKLLEDQAGAELPERALEWIWEKSLGNPLYGLEYFRHLTQTGALWSDGKRWHWRDPGKHPMPMTLEALLEQHLAGVTTMPVVQDVLQAKALLPSGFADTVWQEVSGANDADFAMACMALERHGIFRGTEFAHPLLREVVHAGLTPQQRQNWASRAMAVLEEQRPEEAAMFLQEARWPAAQSLKLLQRAAAAAQDRDDAAAAARFLARAVAYASDGQAGELALLAARGLQQHDIAQTLGLVRVAMQTPTLVAEALPILAAVLALQGEMGVLEAELRTHGRSLEGLAAWRITGHHLAAQHGKVLEVWEHDAEAQRDPPPKVLYAVVLSYLATGRAEEAQVVLAQAQQVVMSKDERFDFSLVGALLHMNVAHYAQAVPLLEEAIVFHRQRSDKRKLSAMLHNLSIAHKELLNYERAQTVLQEALLMRRNMGDLNAYAHSLALMAEILLELGLQSQAEAAIEESLEILQRHPASYFLVNVHSQASCVFEGQHSPLAKLLQQKHANKGQALAVAMNNLRQQQELLYDQALAFVRNSDPQTALGCVAKMRDLAPQVGDPPAYQWRAFYAEGLALEAAGDAGAARHALAEAHNLARGLGNDLYAQKILLELNRLDNDAKAAALRLKWFEERGLKRAANLAQMYFPQSVAVVEDPPTPKHRLDLLGEPLLDGLLLRGQKRQWCLALLAEAQMAGRDGVSKLELLENLYPEQNERKGTASLKQLVHSLREASSDRLILTTNTGYTLGNVQLDVAQFLKTKNTTLWRGTYRQGLEQHNSDSALCDVLYETLQQSLANTSDPQEAMRISAILLEGEPYNHDHLRVVLRVMQSMGQTKPAARVFEAAKERFAELGEPLPSTWKAFLDAGLVA